MNIAIVAGIILIIVLAFLLGNAIGYDRCIADHKLDKPNADNR